MAPGQGSRYGHLIESLSVGDRIFNYYKVSVLDKSYNEMPFCLRVLLESIVRNFDKFHISETDVQNIIEWRDRDVIHIPFKPARVIFQDFTGLPALIDLAAMREAVSHLGEDASQVELSCPVDLIIDHSPSIDLTVRGNPVRSAASMLQTHLSALPSPGVAPAQPGKFGTAEVKWPVSEDVCPFHQLKTEGSALIQRNQQLEFERNKERLLFLKWAENAFDNLRIIPPGTGSGGLHQMNIEATARVVCNESGMLYPDSVMGTDTHTSVSNALGIFSIAGGAIEAEAAMLGHATSIAVTGIVGCCIRGFLPLLASSTDVVLTVTKCLRLANVGSKIVEFFGTGVSQLSMSDRITIANMSSEYGAPAAFFPVDNICLEYLEQSGWHDLVGIDVIRSYLKAVHLLRDYHSEDEDPKYSQVIDVDLGSIKSCCSGPKRQQDRVEISQMKSDFQQCLQDDSDTRGFGLDLSRLDASESFTLDDTEHVLKHGDVLVASITSSTNTSSPLALLAAGLVAKKAVDSGLRVRPFVKTTLFPGPGVVSKYLSHNRLIDCLQKLRFNVSGYGCEKCASNVVPPSDAAFKAVLKGKLVTVGMMSNSSRQCESSVEHVMLANYITSPPLVVTYAIAGNVLLDFDSEPIGHDMCGKPVYLRDIWPSRTEILDIERTTVWPAVFGQVNYRIKTCLAHWDKLDTAVGPLFPWNFKSTYVLCPPFFANMTREVPVIKSITQAYVLLSLGDSVSTDHISVAGSIAKNTPAARYLASKGIAPREFNSYGSRRGNDSVMVRSMFVNSRLQNKLIGKPTPLTLHVPSNTAMEVFDAAMKYQATGSSIIILAGKDYGIGSPRDWVAKGQAMLGVKAVIAESFDEAHRCNLVGAGILPLQYIDGQNSGSLNLSGKETFTIELDDNISINQSCTVKLGDGRSFSVVAMLNSIVELTYYRHGGLLNYAARQFLSAS